MEMFLVDLNNPYENEPWFYYSKCVVAFFWYIDNLYIYYICINTMVKHFVSVAKPWLICGYLGLTIVTLYLIFFNIKPWLIFIVKIR